MNLITLTIANLRFRALNHFFNVIVLGLGIATITTLLHVNDQLAKRFESDLKGIDLVVGAKGSPLQLILSSVFQLDVPTGNISLKDADKLKTNPLIQKTIPLSMGDSVNGFRIVGTTPDYIVHYKGTFASGAPWLEPMQAVIGSEVARLSHLQINQTFVGAHGLEEGGEAHAQTPYKVVGILNATGTVLDRLVLTDLSSVWKIHDAHAEHDNEHASTEKEITSLLIMYKSPLAAVMLPREINKMSALQAASPAFETTRLINMIGMGTDSITLFAGILIIIAALGFFITLFNTVNDRRYDIALMRSLGATRRKIFAVVLSEGVTLGIVGSVVGIALGQAFGYGAQAWLSYHKHITIHATGLQSYEIIIFIVALLVSALAALLPAMMAYRINVSQVLAKG